MKEGMIYQLLAGACRDCRLAFKPSRESEDMDVIYKFAERVVREAARVADEQDGSAPGLMIKKHFGVKE